MNNVLACLSGVKDSKIILSSISCPIIRLLSRIPVNQNGFVGHAIIPSKMDDCSNIAFPSILVSPHPVWTADYSQTNLHFIVFSKNFHLRSRSVHKTFRWQPFWATLKPLPVLAQIAKRLRDYNFLFRGNSPKCFSGFCRFQLFNTRFSSLPVLEWRGTGAFLLRTVIYKR